MIVGAGLMPDTGVDVRVGVLVAVRVAVAVDVDVAVGVGVAVALPVQTGPTFSIGSANASLSPVKPQADPLGEGVAQEGAAGLARVPGWVRDLEERQPTSAKPSKLTVFTSRSGAAISRYSPVIVTSEPSGPRMTQR